ncbi:MAG: prolipoprotein diacylglyceryl transferase, partial [Bacteroidota bacterium]
MHSILSFLIWSQDPVIFEIPLSSLGLADRPIVWYGLLFALGFVISQQIMYKMFVTEGRPQKDVDKLTTYMVIATIVGARLGHCLFYNPSYYLSNPIEILKIWEGGLASHGATIGILIAIWLFVRNTEGYTWLWVLDRLVIVVALTGAMIRTGNLMNSEMEGTETKANYGIVYARGTKEALNFSEEIESVKFRKGGEMQSDEAGRHPVTAIITFNRRSDFGESD